MINKFFSLKTESFFLFPQWNLTSIYGLVLALLAATSIAIIYEIVSFYINLKQTFLQDQHGRTNLAANFGTYCCLAVLHMGKVISGYFLMVCVMSFNMWMLISVILGSGIGFMCARPIMSSLFFRTKDNYRVSSAVTKNWLPRRQKTSADYLPFGLYFNASDPCYSTLDTDHTDQQQQEMTMYISVL